MLSSVKWDGTLAATLVVDDDGVECPGAAYTTISAAVAVASSGDTIQVCPGAYTEQVNVNKDVTITGLGSPVVNPTGPGFSIGASGSGATVEGFKINQSPLAGAIGVFGATGVTVRNNEIHGTGPFTAWYVPWPWAGLSVILSDEVIVERNYIHDTTGAGIWLGSSYNCTIIRNVIEDTQYTGILLPEWENNGPSHDNVILWNSVTGAGNEFVYDSNIRLGAGAYNNNVHHNTATGAVSSGIHAVGTTHDNIIHHNDIRGNATVQWTDARDNSSGGGTAGTANKWLKNRCDTDNPDGLCE